MPRIAHSEALRGACAVPGLGMGRVRILSDPFARTSLRRVEPVQVAGELTRLAAALCRARVQARGAGAAAEAYLLDLRDIVFLSDAEGMLLGEHLCADSALLKVLHDVEQLVERADAGPMRDVVGGVLRQLQDPVPRSGPGEVLVTHDLLVGDLLMEPAVRPVAVAVDLPVVSDQARALARELAIPVLVGVDGLFDAVFEGDRLELDADAGTLRVTG